MKASTTKQDQKKLPISVLIPCLNEEQNLPDCLSSVSWADEVFLVDSNSGDGSCQIAREAGARVIQFDYRPGGPRKKNWALDNLPFANEWVLIVDADERITSELQSEIEEVFTKGPEHVGYYLNRKLIFLGKWLRWGGQFPSWNLRLFKHAKGRYERLNTERLQAAGDVEVHEHVVLEGNAGYLSEPMLHHDFKDLSHFIGRHNRYSGWEAQMRQELLNGNEFSESIPAKFFGSPIQRKRWLKKTWVRLPFRPFAMFVYQFILRGGILDGRCGYLYAMFKAIYEFETDCKMYEATLNGPSTQSPAHPLRQSAEAEPAR